MDEVDGRNASLRTLYIQEDRATSAGAHLCARDGTSYISAVCCLMAH